jgi:hypothetical protein
MRQYLLLGHEVIEHHDPWLGGQHRNVIQAAEVSLNTGKHVEHVSRPIHRLRGDVQRGTIAAYLRVEEMACLAGRGAVDDHPAGIDRTLSTPLKCGAGLMSITAAIERDLLWCA